ncbi:hypothetical protein GCM10008018_72690 [Paenibacillus marchantiophytorum]|uniref:Copper amine oxidase-like N-terminal domain-containing protein n=1 Tax=Paenibacillus marchantiophytorum TaxID=1619310 RepID=A0ABQ1FJT5_9BACL|nr:hypothetical protein [Paenibacillus marchantiophytorum]GGA18163.1 hypothetical protein GCM10008018_72690 [Paenibacillus marchantiophytorum]
MRKVILSFLVLFLSTFSFTISFAENSLQVSLFGGDVVLNGNKLNFAGTEYSTLNYNGHIYVPLRSLSETLQGTVSYNEQENVANINVRGGKDSYKSETSSANSDDFFKLSIHSEKEVYPYGQDMNIWSALTYTGKEEKRIAHSHDLFVYTLMDEHGNTYDPGETLALLKSTFKENDVYISSLQWIIFFGYNDLYSESLRESKTHLKRGTYTVTVRTTYADPEDIKTNHKLQTSIKIKVE